MASIDSDFSDYRKIGPPYDEPPRERGCFFYGCLIAIVLGLLLLIAIGVISFLLYRLAGQYIEEYTSTAPRALPVVEMPAEEREALEKRVEAFDHAVRRGQPTPPLVLTSDDLNALIEDNPKAQLKEKVYVTIEKDRLKGQVSLPLSEIPLFGLTQGRYLNGEAEFNVRLIDGRPYVTIEDFEVNGKRASGEILGGLRGQNVLKDMQLEPETERALRNIESLEIKDGRMILKARTPSGDVGAGPATLPDDVMAPPDSLPAAPIDGAGSLRSSP